MQTKTCTKCKVEKPLTEFHKRKNGKYGVNSQCKPCTLERNREYYSHPEIQEKMKEYKSRPEVKMRERKYNRSPERREYMREYRQRPEVKERRRESQREYYQRPEVKERKREYAREHGFEYRQRPEVRERRSEYNRMYGKMELRDPHRIEIAAKHATRSGKWSDAEIEFLMSSDLPLVDIALELGRTYQSVHQKRFKVRKQFSANTPS